MSFHPDGPRLDPDQGHRVSCSEHGPTVDEGYDVYIHQPAAGSRQRAANSKQLAASSKQQILACGFKIRVEYLRCVTGKDPFIKDLRWGWENEEFTENPHVRNSQLLPVIGPLGCCQHGDRHLALLSYGVTQTDRD